MQGERIGHLFPPQFRVLPNYHECFIIKSVGFIGKSMVFTSDKNISTTTYATIHEVLTARAYVLMLMSVVKTELKG